jgi:hypothetical protein
VATDEEVVVAAALVGAKPTDVKATQAKTPIEILERRRRDLIIDSLAAGMSAKGGGETVLAFGTRALGRQDLIV